MLVQVNKSQKLQKVHDWRIIGGTKFPYKEYSPILNILKKLRSEIQNLSAAQN